MKLSALRDFGFGGAVRAWTQFTALGMVIFAGRVLTQDEFGVYAIASVFTTLISTVLFSGLYEFIVKTDDRSDVSDTCFCINVAIASFGALAMVALAPLVARAVGAPELRDVMWLLAPTCFLPALTSWQEAHLLRQGRIKTYYGVWFFAETVSAGIAIVLLAYGFKIDALIAYRYSLGLLTAAGYFANGRLLPGLSIRRHAAQAAWSFASRLFASRIIGIVSNYSADLIIGILAGPAQAGAYRLAKRLVFGAGEVWYQPVKTMAWVKFSAAARDGRPFTVEWLALMAILSVVAWPTLACVAILAPELISTLLGHAWLAAAPVISILAIAKAFELFEIFLDPLLTLSGRVGWLVRIRLAVCCLSLCGFLATASFGAVPAALVMVLIYGGLAGVTLGLGLKLCPAKGTDLSALSAGVATTIAVVVAGFATFTLTGQAGFASWQRILSVACVSVLVWALVLVLIFRPRMLAIAAALQARH